MVMQEYAGLPGSSTSAHFLKSVTQSHLSRALYEGSNVVSTRSPCCAYSGLFRTEQEEAGTASIDTYTDAAVDILNSVPNVPPLSPLTSVFTDGTARSAVLGWAKLCPRVESRWYGFT